MATKSLVYHVAGQTQTGPSCWQKIPRTHVNPLGCVSTLVEFSTIDEAVTQRDIREATAQDITNPFYYGGATLIFQTDLLPDEFHGRLSVAGLKPPSVLDSTRLLIDRRNPNRSGDGRLLFRWPSKIPFLKTVRQLANLLEEQGVEYRVTQRNSGHDFDFWNAELRAAISWAFSR
jgi:hypothetical protein